MVKCPVCGKGVKEAKINLHLDSDCAKYVDSSETNEPNGSSQDRPSVSNFFQTPLAKRSNPQHIAKLSVEPFSATKGRTGLSKRSLEQADTETNGLGTPIANGNDHHDTQEPAAKKQKAPNAFQKAAPLAERMRPKTLADVCGQELVGPSGVLRGLIEQDRVPSMILWGSAGTGKTTIARVVAGMVGSRFVEINSTSSGVAECKKIFAEAKSELGLTGRKTIVFCDEIHRLVNLLWRTSDMLTCHQVLKVAAGCLFRSCRERNRDTDWCYNRESFVQGAECFTVPV